MSIGLRMGKKDVGRLGNCVQLFSGEKYYRDGDNWVQEKKLRYDGCALKLRCNCRKLDHLFSEIRCVYDESGIKIAERLNERCELLSTGKGKSKRIRSINAKSAYFFVKGHLEC